MQTLSTPHISAPWSARLPRLTGWLLITLLLLVAVWLIAPQQLPVSLYKLSLVSLAGVVGYWLDRSLFPYARPDAFFTWRGKEAETTTVAVCDQEDITCTLTVEPEEGMALLFAAAMVRRALIVAAAMVAMGLGA